MRPFILVAIVLTVLLGCSRPSPTPHGKWTLDKKASRVALIELYNTNPRAKAAFDELAVEPGETPVDALLSAISSDYDIAEDQTYSHTFKVTRDIPPHLKMTELQQTGVWKWKAPELTLQPTTQNGATFGGPPEKSLVTSDSVVDTMTYMFFGATLFLRRA